MVYMRFTLTMMLTDFYRLQTRTLPEIFSQVIRMNTMLLVIG